MEKKEEKNNKINTNKWHSREVKETLSKFSSQVDGLEKEDAKNRLEKEGPNKIRQDDAHHPVLIFLRQFNSGLIYVLFAAAFIAGIFEKWIDVYVILGIIVLNSIMGFFQEYKAEKAIQALKNMTIPAAKVYRGGELLKIPAEKIVPGDIVLLEEGDKVPADMRLFYTKDFRVNEASLTGESNSANKSTEAIIENSELGDRKNMSWMGTFVSGGRAKGIVVATGEDTIFGSIAKDMGEAKKGGGHFEEKVSILSKRMAIFAFTGASLIFLISVIKGGVTIYDGFDAFEEPLFAAIAALVSGIPEGLPAILVVVLAVGATRMAKRNAIIRHLPVTESLGVATHIVSDKTGTITQNTMTVREIIIPAKEENIKVMGEGWEPKGDFYFKEEQIIPQEEEDLVKLLHIAEICNQAQLTYSENDNGNYEVIGDPTEAALVVLAEKAGLKQEVLQREEEKIDDMPFNLDLKVRASLVEKERGREVYVVGAPESVIKKANRIRKNGEIKKITAEEKEEILSQVENLSEKAMRTIGIAYKETDEKAQRIESNMLENLILTGVVGMIDPPRSQVKEAVERARKAGIKTIMTTGDHKKTAIAVAEKTGILPEHNEKYPKALEQIELEQMNEEEFKEAIKNVSVFARLTPHMKFKIATTLQEEGAIIAMTGDGVNDAPAVKQADIGIAMGIMGTDVTKEAGDIVLTDDNFASIVSAIEEGRVVFENTRKSSSSLATTNFAEIGTITTFLLINLPLPLLPTQILWLNLVTDGVVGAPLALEPKHEDVLKKPPRDKKETILTAEIIPYFVLMTLLMVTITFFIFNMFYANGEGVDKARTGAFTVMAFTQLYNAINLRSIRRSVFEIGFFANKYLIGGIFLGVILQLGVIWIPGVRDVFHFVPLSVVEVILIALLTSSVLFVGEFYKHIRYGRKKENL